VGAIKQKAAYLRGLAEGLGYGDDAKEGRLLKEIISLLSEVADELDVLSAKQAELEDHIEGLDEDVADLEHLVYDDDDLLEVTCPHCHEEFFDPRLLDDDVEEMTCPVCGEVIIEDEDEDLTDSDFDEEDEEDEEEEDDDDDDDDDDDESKGRH